MKALIRTLRDAATGASARRSQFALTIVAVALSVAFLTATLVLADSLTGTAAADIAEAHDGIDYVVTGETVAAGEGGPGEAPETIEAELDLGLPSRLAQHPDIAAAIGVDEGFAKLVRDGVAIGDDTAIDVGRPWVDDPLLNTFELAQGSPPRTMSEIVIDVAVAEDGGLALGDTVQVVTATGVHDLSITGLARFGGAARAPLQRTVLFSADGAAELMEIDGYSEVLIRSSAGIEAVRAAVRDIDATAVVVDRDEAVASKQNEITSPFAFLSTFLLVFAVLAVMVGATIIYNTFAIAMAQRRREVALRRAIGATRRSILLLVLVETALVAIAATAAGIGAGLAGVRIVRSVVTALGVPFIDGPTVVTAPTLLIAAGVGIVVTIASAWQPAARASRAAPVEALREAASEPVDGSTRGLVGLMVLAAGATGLVAAATVDSAPALAVGALVVPGLVLAGPSLVMGTSRIARSPLRTGLGPAGTIAVDNLRRNPKRSSSTSLGLVLGVALVGFFAVIAHSLSASLTTTLDERLSVDHVVASVAPGYSTVDPGLADRLRAIEGIGAVGAISIVDAGADGAEAVVGGLDGPVATMFDFETTEGSLDGLADGGVAVWTGGEVGPPAIGDTVTIALPSGEVTAPVVALFAESLSGFDPPTHLVASSVLTAVETGVLDNAVFVTVDDEAAAGELRDAVAATPGALLQSESEYVASASTGVDSIRNLVFAMLALTVVIAVVGVANTTVLAISERVREIGMLRAIGATQRDVRRIVRWEAALLAVMGTAIGLAVSILAAWALIGAVGGSDLTAAAIPWRQLAVVSGGAVLAAVASASAPAWRISRRPVLDALNG
ncbi:MAG: ABC transporter permease [Acidimicrobiales bacterium]